MLLFHTSTIAKVFGIVYLSLLLLTCLHKMQQSLMHLLPRSGMVDRGTVKQR